MGGIVHDTSLQVSVLKLADTLAQQYVDEDITIVLYRDDFHTITSPDIAIPIAIALEKHLHDDLNVLCDPSKRIIYSPREACDTDEDHVKGLNTITEHLTDWHKERNEALLAEGDENVSDIERAVQDTLVTEGVKLLGTPIGTKDFVVKAVRETLTKYPAFTRRLRLVDAHVALNILRTCHLPIANHLTRTVDPRRFVEVASEFDHSVIELYADIVGDETIKESLAEDGGYGSWLGKIVAPLKHGGMGLRKTEITCPLAFFCSNVQALATLKNVDPECAAAIEAFASEEDEEEGAVVPDPSEEEVQEALEHEALKTTMPSRLLNSYNMVKDQNPDKGLLPNSFLELMQGLADGKISPRKLQHVYQERLDNDNHDHARSKMSSIEKSRDNSLSSRGASALFGSECMGEFSLPPAAMSTTCKIRTGTLTLPNLVCCCGKTTTSLDHVLSCKKLRGRFTRHDVFVKLLNSMLRDAGCVARKEVRVVGGSQKRMDIVIYLPQGERMWIDVSVVNPEAPTYLGKKDAAVEIREKEKNAKWRKLAKERGIEFIPAVIDIYGGSGAGFESILQYIALKAMSTQTYISTSSPPIWKGMYVSLLRQRLSTTLAYGNYLMIEEACLLAQTGSRRGLGGQSNAAVHKLYKGFQRHTSYNRGRLRF
jgi:hypothetical protein